MATQKTRQDLPTTVDALTKEAAKVRKELAEARRQHALQKLDSTAKLREMRARLARILTVKRQKEANAK